MTEFMIWLFTVLKNQIKVRLSLKAAMGEDAVSTINHF